MHVHALFTVLVCSKCSLKSQTKNSWLCILIYACKALLKISFLLEHSMRKLELILKHAQTHSIYVVCVKTKLILLKIHILALSNSFTEQNLFCRCTGLAWCSCKCFLHSFSVLKEWFGELKKHQHIGIISSMCKIFFILNTYVYLSTPWAHRTVMCIFVKKSF